MSGHRNVKRRCGESHLESPAGCGHGPAAGCVLSKLVQLPTPPLSKHQLKRLEEHKYQSAGRSLLEPLMQGYWEWLVGRVPAWIAPNLITIVGLLINIFTTLLLVYYCPTATEQVSDEALTILVHGYCHLVAAGTVLWRVLGLGEPFPMGQPGSRRSEPVSVNAWHVWAALRARVDHGVCPLLTE